MTPQNKSFKRFVLYTLAIVLPVTLISLLVFKSLNLSAGIFWVGYFVAMWASWTNY